MADYIIIFVIGFLLLGFIINFYNGFFGEPSSDKVEDVLRGSARWATTRELKNAGMFSGKLPIFLGKVKYKYLSWGDHAIGKRGHLATIAPSRAGKGIGLVIPNLLKLENSVFILDVKGENAKETAMARHKNQSVKIIDPFDETEAPESYYDPMSYIKEFEDAAFIAEMLLPEAGEDKIWVSKGRQLIALALWFQREKELPFATLSETLSGDVSAKLEVMVDEFISGEGKQNASSFLADATTSERMFGSVVATARDGIAWLGTDRMQKHFSTGKTFNPQTMFSDRQSLYLVVPPDRLETMRNYLRLIVGCTLSELQRFKGAKKTSVLFLLDEFPALGKFSPIESGMGYLAGYGVQIWLFAQDLAQLRKIYGDDGSRAMLAQCEVELFFGCKEHRTAEYVSNRLGKTTIKMNRVSHSSSSRRPGEMFRGSSSSSHNTEEERLLLTPDEVVQFEHVIGFIKGLRPVRFELAPFWTLPK